MRSFVVRLSIGYLFTIVMSCSQREIRRQGGLKTLVRLLDTANDQLQENVAAVLGNCVDGTKAKKVII